MWSQQNVGLLASCAPDRHIPAIILGSRLCEVPLRPMGSGRSRQVSPPYIITGLAQTPERDLGAIADRYASKFLKILRSPLFHCQVCLNVRMSGRGILVCKRARKIRKRGSRKESAPPSYSQYTAHRGACGKTRAVPHSCQPKPEPCANGRHEMRVSLSVYGSRGDVEPMVGLAVHLGAVGVPPGLIRVWR